MSYGAWGKEEEEEDQKNKWKKKVEDEETEKKEDQRGQEDTGPLFSLSVQNPDFLHLQPCSSRGKGGLPLLHKDTSEPGSLRMEPCVSADVME